MIRWIPYTFVRIVIFFIAGILLGIYSPDIIPETFAWTSLAILIVLYFISYFFTDRQKFNPSFVAWPAVFLVGYIHLLLQTDTRLDDHIINQRSPTEYYQVMITRYPEEKQKSWKLEAEVKAIGAPTWQRSEGKIVLYFSKEDFKTPFNYGDILLVKGSPDLLKPPGNPGEFDYKSFLAFRNVYHQHFLRKDDVIRIGNEPPNIVMAHAIKARLWADATLKKFVSGQREQAIASALVLGVTDGLDNELLNAYAATGAMHVLAVSGLHITIIYLIIVWLLKPLNKLRSGPWMMAVISLFILWAYAFVTGLSPSVLRAVTMFSFLALARPWSRDTNIFNTLAASACLLLLYDPYLIMSVGFQLSYLAVIGIVYLYPRIYPLWEANNRVMEEVWKITCVSIAAQVATFSLGLLYFHQFPNYFLLSNLLVIPLSSGILVMGLMVLAVSFIGVIASIMSTLLGWLIKLVNIIVFAVEQLPFSLIENIYITTFQCWLMMGIVMVFLLMIEYKKFSFALIGAAMVLVFSFFQWWHFSEEVNLRKITVYKVSGHSAIDLIDQGRAWFVTDSLLLHDRAKLRFHINPNRLQAGVGKVYDRDPHPFVRMIAGGKIISWKGKIMLIIEQRNFIMPLDVSADMIVISNNAITDLRDLGHLQTAKVIVDSSNSFYHAEKLMAQGTREGFNVYSVLHQGAYEIKIERST